jgi:MtrB/PioB family decaheme-associated outer membrane protein
LRFAQSRQGSWGYFVDFSQMPRYSPYSLATRLTGYDGSTQAIGGSVAPSSVEPRTERRRLELGLDKLVAGGWEFKLRLRNEEKDGRRLYGRMGGAAGPDFLADPIDYTTQAIEATAAYTGGRLQLSGGFYGTRFVNRKARLDVLGGAGTTLTPIALPPGSQSQQLYLSGGYDVTPLTRATFKIAYGRATQNDVFVDASALGRAGLGGRVDTTLVQMGLTARPLPRLSVLANVRYDDRRDLTPAIDFFNASPRSIRTLTARLEASYRLPLGLRLTGVADYDRRRRDSWPAHIVSFRERTEESAHRIELRRSMSGTVSGSLAYLSSRRTGSPFLATTLAGGAPSSNLVAPYQLADRDRDRWRARLGWVPLEALDLHFTFEDARDEYSGRVLGARKGSSRSFSADAAYGFSEAWRATAWISRDGARLDQVTCQNASVAGACPGTLANPAWAARLENVGVALGLGLRGRTRRGLEIGADVQYARDRAIFDQKARTPGAVVGQVPASRYTRTAVRLYGRYAVRKNLGVRLSVVRERFSVDDYAWGESFSYSDGTRVFQAPTQTATFVGLSAYHRFE